MQETGLSAEDKPDYLQYIHNLRGLAILVIVGIHCRVSFPWGDHVLGNNVWVTLLDNGTVIFVFIAGFLFQHINHNRFNYPKYLLTKLKFVILPYVLVSIIPILDKLYIEEVNVWLPASLAEANNFLKVIYMLLTGKHFGPFWFIPMIGIFYLISPLLLLLDKPRFYSYIFPILFLAGLFTFRFGYYSNTLDSFVHFFPVYLLGMAASRYKEFIIRSPGWIIYMMVAVYAVIALLEIQGLVVLNKLVSFEEAALTHPTLLNYGKLKVSILCLILVYSFHKIKMRKLIIFKVLGDYSFGIFFIHLYFIIAFQILGRAYFPGFTLNSFTFIMYTLLISLLSVMVVMLAKKIFAKNSRYLIGT